MDRGLRNRFPLKINIKKLDQSELRAFLERRLNVLTKTLHAATS